MVANILMIGFELHELVVSLKKRHYGIYLANNFERALRIVRNRNVDVVLVSLEDVVQDSIDFFYILRQLCQVVPIIGLASSYKIPKIPIDALIHVGDSIESIIHKIDLFAEIRNKFNIDPIDNLDSIDEFPGKIAILLHDDCNFIDTNLISANIVKRGELLPEDIDSDLFIINCEKNKAERLCAKLRLNRIYSPVIFTYNVLKDKCFFDRLYSVGGTDIVPTSINPQVFSLQVNSLIKYKKMYDLYLKNIREQSYCSAIDAMTGVYNRSFFEGYIKKYSIMTASTAVFMIDVDKFKLINDKFGHAFADIALNNIVRIIKGCIRSSDIIARYGGDEFVIVMQEVTKKSTIEIAERIQKEVSDFTMEDASFSVSIGLCCECLCISVKEAISIADRFMYIAKHNGGNTVRVCR